MDATKIENWPSVEEIEARLAEEGTAYAVNCWKLLKAYNITLTTEMADRFYVIQQYYLKEKGYSLPQVIKGARKTKAQLRDDLGPMVDEKKLDSVVKGGLAARLAQMRKGK